MARPTSLTPEVQRIIVEALREGMYREVAATLAGIHRDSLFAWMARGATGEEPFKSFSDAVKSAEAEAEREVVREARSGCEGWQARAWLAERRWPSRWGGRVRATVNDELTAVLKRIEAKLDPETYAKVIDAAREDDAGSSAEVPRH